MTDWYYSDTTNRRQGPIDAETLAGLHREGQIAPETLVWRDGLEQWQPWHTLVSEVVPAVDPPVDAMPADAVPEATADAMDFHAREATPATPASPYAPPTSQLAEQDDYRAGGEVVYAGFWRRVAAYVIDGFIVGIAGMVVGGIVGGLIGVGFATAGGDMAGFGFALIQLASNLLGIAIAAAYYGGFHASTHRATPGKMAVGIKVVRPNGERITLARGIGRYFATILSSLILLIGFLMAAFTQRKQALHDMICDTLVVDKWAFTGHPERQQRGLGTVTIVVLAIFGVLTLFFMIALIGAIGMLSSIR